MSRVWTVADMAVRELLRRRGVLAMLVLLPLVFYLSRRGDHQGQSVRFVCLGLGWALSTAALFAGSAARAIEPRLRISGYAAWHLWVGRLAALWLLGALLSAPFFLLVRLDQPDVRHGAVAVIMALTVLVAAPLGLALASALPRELEGTLLLLIVVGMQMVLDPADPATRALPFWFSREIGTYAVDHTGTAYLGRGVLHGTVLALALTALVAITAGVRLRRRRHWRAATA